jgi:post-segregation antitoxin (ccd killing protein)
LTLWCFSYITTLGGNTMTTQAKRATVYLDPDLHRALRLKAVETSRSISELVNKAIREALAEDAEDIAALEERAGEPLISYDEMVKRLKRDGRI